MYEDLDISGVEKAGENFVLKHDRAQYVPIFKAAEEFCATNKFIIGGKLGIDLLTNTKQSKDSWFWEFYCDIAAKKSKEMVNYLYAQTGETTLNRTTDIRTKEYTISANGVVMFKIYSFEKHRTSDIKKYLAPVTKTGYFQNEVLVMPEEIQLIEIYHDLYNPTKKEQWEILLDKEKRLFTDVRQKNLTTIEGGHDKKISPFHSALLALQKLDVVIIGDHAIKALGFEQKSCRVQIITNVPIYDLLQLLKKQLNNNLTSVYYRTYLPIDFQLTKHIIYMENKTPLVDVFNCTRYELIPYSMGRGAYNGFKIANLVVLIRFQFIDIWSLKLLLSMNINQNFVKQRINSCLAKSDILREKMLQMINQNPFDVFQLTNYAGVYLNPFVVKKKLIKKLGEKFTIYYPAKKMDQQDEVK